MDDKAMPRELELRTLCPTSDHWPDTYMHEKALLAACNEIRQFVADGFDQLDAIEDNRDLTPEAKKRLKTKIGGQIIGKMQASPTHGRIRETIDHVLQKWQHQIDDNIKRPANAHEEAVHAQIRDRLYAMKGDRMSWLEKNIDDALISAVLTAPSYLTGLSDAEYQFVKSQLEKKVAPEILAARKFVQEAVDDIERGWKAGMHKIGTRAGLSKSADGGWSQPVDANAA